MKDKTIKFIYFILLILSLPLFSVFAATTSVVVPSGRSATLTLNPTGGSYVIGSIFSLGVILDTQGNPISGVDLRYLRYDPSLLEIQDDDVSVAGVQIAAGDLMPNIIMNSVNTATGRVAFSQLTNAGTSFTGSGALATMRFKVLASGIANVTFDFIPGNTVDTNVASEGVDILISVANGSYTLALDSASPSIPKILSVAVLDPYQISVSWTTSTDNVAVVGYRISRNGMPIATSTVTAYIDSNLVPATSYVYTVAAYDAAGNISLPSLEITTTTNPHFVKGVSFVPSLEAMVTTSSRVFTFIFFTSGTTTPFIQFTGNLDTAGKISIPDAFSMPIGTYDVLISSPGYLRRRVSAIALVDNLQISIPALFTGDVNGDNTVNLIDWSLMYMRWLTGDVAADLNNDGIINSVDLSLLNKNWLYAGDI